MAAGSAFTLAPNEVETIAPEYNNVQSQTESMKKEYYQISSTAVERYKLSFKVLSNTDRDTLLAHVKDQSDDFYEFSWQSVPSYIGGGANISGRWVKKTLTMTPILNHWRCSIVFEKSN